MLILIGLDRDRTKMKSIQFTMVMVFLLGGLVLEARIPPQEQERPVTRAKRPVFDKKDWSGVFFEDIFSDGLAGKRPGKVDPDAKAQTKVDGAGSTAETSEWSSLIEGTILENEVKRWQQTLNDQVTSPVKFKTSHREIGDQFSMLAMWFSIISQYDGDVRWNEEANSVRAAFMDAASKCRDTDMAAFNNVKRRTEDLTELVRGGKFPEESNAESDIGDWSMIIERGPIMNRLELSVLEELKQPTASEKDFQGNIDLIKHEAGLISALGRVLQLPEMMDADDEDYSAFAQEMLAAALEMKTAADEKNLEGVNQALNRINQACSKCHGDYR